VTWHCRDSQVQQPTKRTLSHKVIRFVLASGKLTGHWDLAGLHLIAISVFARDLEAVCLDAPFLPEHVQSGLSRWPLKAWRRIFRIRSAQMYQAAKFTGMVTTRIIA